MAKQRGPVASTFTGRVGNVVGAKMKGGEYVTRSYQPSVKNSNTLRQRVSRQRLAKASIVASVFAPVLNIGYAMSASKTKMSPRNMFVHDIVPMSSGVLFLDNNTMVIRENEMPLSKKMGIDEKPIVTYRDEVEGLDFTITCSSSVKLKEGEKIGVVLVGIGQYGNGMLMRKSIMNANNIAIITVPYTDIEKNNVKAFGVFMKIIPASKNDVSTVDEPWKYPSATSATTLIAE